MPSYSTFYLSIWSEDSRLVEYGREDITDNNGTVIVTCWVASEAGKEFYILIQNKARSLCFDTLSRVFVDGQLIWNVPILRRHDHPASGKDKVVDNVPTGHDTFSTLKWAEIELTDDAHTLTQEPNPAIGEMRIEIYAGEEIPKNEDDKTDDCNPVSLTPVIVHETSFKAGFHSVQPARPSSPPLDLHIDFELEEFPLVTFVFKYRPMRELQAKGLAPPGPQHDHLTDDEETPSVIKSEEDDLSQAAASSRGTEPGHDSQPSLSCKVAIKAQHHLSSILASSRAESLAIKAEPSTDGYPMLEHPHPSSPGENGGHHSVISEPDIKRNNSSSLCVDPANDYGNVKIEKREDIPSELSIEVRIEEIKLEERTLKRRREALEFELMMTSNRRRVEVIDLTCEQ